MKKYLSENGYNLACSLFSVVLMWVVWLVAYAVVGNDYLVPSFFGTAEEFFALFAEGFFWAAFGHTLLRTLVAFLISFALGFAAAAAGVAFAPFARFLRPIIAVCRTLPTMAVLLLILVWMSPRSAPVVVTVLVLFPVVYTQLTSSVSGVDGGLIEMAKAYRLTTGQKIFKIYVPQIAPVTVSQTGANLSFGIKLTISAEVMAHTYTALGGLMSEAQTYYNLTRLAALTLCAIFAGIVAELIFRLIARYAFAWKRGEEV